MDTVTPEQRSQIMSRIRSRDTKPELLVRRMLFAHGYRFRVCDRRIAGHPDIVIPRCRALIEVRGCFWSKATLWVKAQHEGALPPPCIVRKDPQVPHTARQVACHSLNNLRCVSAVRETSAQALSKSLAGE